MIEQKPTESFVEYVGRITGLLEEGTIGYKEWGDLLLGDLNVYSGENCRKASYFIKKLIPKLEPSDDIDTNAFAENIKAQKEELYKERVKLQDQRREYNKLLKSEARYEHLVEAMKESIENLDPIELYEHKNPPQTNVQAALLISDLHYGAMVDNVLNFYNTEVCKERMDVLLDKTVYYCGLHHVDTLYVNLGGDLVTGIIHGNTRCEAEEDIISQTIQVGELLSQFIGRLQKHVANIKIIAVQGNHSRVTPKKDDSVNEENFERIVFEMIKIRLPSIPMIMNGKEDWCEYEIKGRKVLLEHGDKTKLNNAKEKAVNMLGYAPDDIFLGHWHHMEMTDSNGTDIIVNGSVMGVDSYSMRRRLNTQPYQILRIYGDDISTYKILLNN